MFVWRFLVGGRFDIAEFVATFSKVSLGLVAIVIVTWALFYFLMTVEND